MSPEVWAIVGVVIGAVLGGGAQIVAGVLTDRRAHVRWLREQRVDAYRAVLQQTESTLRGLRDASERRDEGSVPWDWDGGIYDLMQPVELFGSSEVATAANRLSYAFNLFGHTMPGVDDVTNEMSATHDARDAYLAAVRADLGVK